MSHNGDRDWENFSIKVKSAQTTDLEKKNDQIEELQSEIQKLENSRNEERFLFGMFILVLLDVIFFSHTDGWGAPLTILILELIIIIIMAKRLGVEEITNILDKYILNGYLRRNNDNI